MPEKMFKFDIPQFQCQLKELDNGSEVSCKGSMKIWCPPMDKFETPLGNIYADIQRTGSDCYLKGMKVDTNVIGSKEITGLLIDFTKAMGL